MKIAILSLSNRPTLPPETYGYGGMTRVNWWLADELACLGHNVTLFAHPRTVPPTGVGLVEYPKAVCMLNTRCAGDKKAVDKAMAIWFQEHHLGDFDVIHEMSHRHPVALFCDGPILATMQNPNKRKRWGFWARNLVAVSPTHAKLYPKREGGKGNVPYVFNAVRVGAQPFTDVKNGPFLLMGVMQSYKGVRETIEAAIEANVSLILAGTRGGSGYYKEQCKPLVDSHANIEFVGEVQGHRKDLLVARAKAAMLYVKWNEPGTMFGVEAMAAGTPIIGSNRGCIPDYVVSCKTGYIVGSISAMATAMTTVGALDPVDCYRRYLAAFTVERQAQRYLRLYKRTIEGERW